jgi:hypothetical protein
MVFEWAEELLGPKNAFFVESQKLTIWVQFHFALFGKGKSYYFLKQR